jgi:hypothetical protein|tara:strand:- start:884 stop:1339 length:456 start_codon:yes stop_codon:yes gene_type:complete
MTLNPEGFVQISDFGNPKIFSGKARVVISGGQVVGCSGATAKVSSGLSSYVTDDVELYVADDAENCVGIALETVASGATLGVAADGIFILPCFGSVFAGRLVRGGTSDAVANVGSQVIPANAQDSSMAGNAFGRSLTAGASGGFAIVHVHA